MSDFAPGAWLRNRHLQSIVPSLPLRRWLLPRDATLARSSNELLLDCGDGVTLQALHARAPSASATIAVLLHGWEGSAQSPYLLCLGNRLLAQGHDVVRLNLRDHGATHHLNREIFHSCRLPEVIGAVRALQERFDDRQIVLAGFSLGGNFMLRVAAQAPAAGLRIARVVAISPVLDPARTLWALERGLPIYRHYFIWKWSRSLLRKQAVWPQDHDFRALLRCRDLRRMTAELVQRCTPFASIDDYLEGYALTGARLARLTVPCHILGASDDPIIPVEDFSRLAPGPHLHITLTPHGGHSGFIEGLTSASWANRFVLESMSA